MAGIATAVEVLWISRSPYIASQLSSITLIIIIKLKQNQSTTESRSNNTNVKPKAKSNRSQKTKSPNRNAERKIFNRLIGFKVNLNNNSGHKTKQNKTIRNLRSITYTIRNRYSRDRKNTEVCWRLQCIRSVSTGVGAKNERRAKRKSSAAATAENTGITRRNRW